MLRGSRDRRVGSVATCDAMVCDELTKERVWDRGLGLMVKVSGRQNAICR